MRSALLVIFCSIGLVFQINAQDQVHASNSVEVIEAFQNMYQYQNYYLSGQPSLEAMQWLKKQGVTMIINIRTEGENEDFAEEAYNEEAVANTLGFDYHHIPVRSSTDYTPEKLKEISALLNADEKILFHCGGAGRVTNFFMAYLVRSRGYSIDEAIDVGKELKFSFPLEKILGTEIHMEIHEE